MKKIVVLALLIISTVTGCSNVEVSTSIEDFYLKSVIEKVEDVSLEEAKKALKNFEYEYRLEEISKQFSKEEIENYEKEFGEKLELSDISYTIFSDNGSKMEFIFDETNKKNDEQFIYKK